MSDGMDKFRTLSPGHELGVSAWHRVAQSDVDAFGRLTHDEDPFHTDPEAAATESPYGTTISYGFFTLSMLSYFANQVLSAKDIESGHDVQMLNFGFNRIRMPEAVPVGSEIRARFEFAGARERPSGGLEVTLASTVEIRDKEKPALVAEWLFVAMPIEGFNAVG